MEATKTLEEIKVMTKVGGSVGARADDSGKLGVGLPMMKVKERVLFNLVGMV